MNTGRYGVRGSVERLSPASFLKAAAILLLLLASALPVAAQSVFPGRTWKKADLDQQGWSAESRAQHTCRAMEFQ
jgi:hypothetical protein